jgi:ornithine cyclodeaminase/alanine dehydrogenase-like protein (mu-crystallin family)
MIYLDCSGIRFGSQLDEKHLFEWAREISGVLRWEQDTLVIRSKRISQEALRDLLSLFSRYKIPMEQLAQFRTPKNEGWFTAPHMYWHKKVFGKQFSPAHSSDVPTGRRVASR